MAAPEAAVAVACLFDGGAAGVAYVVGGDESSLDSDAAQLFLDQRRRRSREAVVGDLRGRPVLEPRTIEASQSTKYSTVS